MAERLAEVRGPGARIDVAFRLEENVWRGRTELQAKLLDLRPAE
jgi:hypothetical protein